MINRPTGNHGNIRWRWRTGFSRVSRTSRRRSLFGGKKEEAKLTKRPQEKDTHTAERTHINRQSSCVHGYFVLFRRSCSGCVHGVFMSRAHHYLQQQGTGVLPALSPSADPFLTYRQQHAKVYADFTARRGHTASRRRVWCVPCVYFFRYPHAGSRTVDVAR